ncbi:hypothetical protein C0Q70_04558 [Pomacea canaliculata]|uniref:Vacuolar protein sorting-associated protein 18 homolog n=1 Tax=Pomacea canaliculata TaxID=400727 RepID=A0A2T7PIQ4_POMCA|nr:hypothetical protein C0Q70_04558 [Pomacea canaliculata]
MASILDQYEEEFTRTSTGKPAVRSTAQDIVTEIELPSPVTDRVHQIFLDPTGKHLLISLGSQENYYVSLGTSARKPKNIAKLKGHLIDSVGWNWQNANEKTTGAILLGTNKGLIFETELTQFDDSRFFQGNVDLYLKQLFNLGRERAEPVTGLQFDRMPCSDLSVYRYYILVTTPGRLYQFIGTVSTSADPPMFTPLFQQYESGAGPGIYYGNIDVTGSAGPNSVMSSSKLIPYPKDIDEQKVHPIGMALTEFHMLVLYSDRWRSSCVMISCSCFCFKTFFFFFRFGRMLGIRKDPIRGTIWAFSSQVVFFYKVCRESRDVWQMYLEKGDFEVAKKYCQDSRFNLEKVLIKQAEHLFEIGKYEESAAMYAQTQNSFEEVALKFIKLSNKEPLQTFIIEKLSSLRPQDKTQMTMLVTWIVELFLNTLGRLKEQGQDETYEYESTQEKFRKFMASMRIKECITLNRTVIYDLISSHGDIEDLVFFAHLMKDYERVINHHFHHENYRGALECLIKQPDIELYYKFSPVLMQHLPRETVDAWIRVGKQLDPKKLIPALVQYDHLRNIDQGNEAIRYLETCIQKFENRDSAIHNYLLALYAKFQPDHLMTYLQLQGEDPDEICYDVKYALRLCTECNHHRACVHVYSLMGLYEEAVDMALTVDVELAKQQANKPAEDDLELRKKLWLRIARHVVEEEKDIKRAMEFLHECDLLKIEDVLPFFPDFVTIDHFKDAIVSSLQEYNQHIESLKIEMEEATQSAEEIRREIQSFRNKYSLVKAEDKCSVCTYPLMSRAFYLFPCGHKFHMDCLIAEVLPTLPTSKKSQVESLQRKLAEMEGSPAHNRAPGGPEKAAKDMDVQTKLHDLVSSECIFCGDFMIRCIDKQFVEEEKWSIIVSEWE